MHSADDIAAVAAALNTRPRKTLAEALDQLLISAMSKRRPELTVLGCHPGFRYVASPDPRSKLHSLVRLSGTIPRSRPASGRVSRAGLVQDAACGTGAQRRLVLDETEHGAMLVQVGPPASSKTATPNHVLPVIPGDRNELVECHSEATRGRSPVCPIGQQRSCCDDQLNPPNTPPANIATSCRLPLSPNQ